MRKLIAVVLLVLFTLGFVSVVNAQALPNITVCRDSRYPWVRLQFHNMPAPWWGGLPWKYVGDNATLADNTLSVDGLAVALPGYPVGSAAVIIGRYRVTGNASSPKCPIFIPAFAPRKPIYSASRP